jgi:heme-degrading monooxygenase HmoA
MRGAFLSTVPALARFPFNCALLERIQGFISANIHRSLDGTRVTSYAQWQRREAFEAMLGDPEAAEHMGEAARIAERFEPHLYEVSFVEEV